MILLRLAVVVIGLPLLLLLALFFRCVCFLPFVFEPRCLSDILLRFVCLLVLLPLFSIHIGHRPK